jgi:hypothetical protein
MVVLVPPGIHRGLGRFDRGERPGVVEEVGLQALVPALDLADRGRLTGQSRLILWTTGRSMTGLLSGFAAGAFEAADGFLVAADLGGDGFQAAAQLVDLDGQAGQGAGILAAGAVFLDDGAQVGPPVKGGAADARAGGDFPEGDGLPGGGELGAGGLDPGQLDPGQLAAVSWHGPGR